MVRIKVVEGSRLLLILVVTLLVAALIVIGASFIKSGAKEASTGFGQTHMVEREAAAVFAAASSAPREVVFGVPHENEHTDAKAEGFDIEILPRSAPSPALMASPTPSAAAPSPAPVIKQDLRVLIYHTHTHEAYQQDDRDPYAETEPWRTMDAAHSIVRVGDELAQLLMGFGVKVVHDTTDHEPPKLGTAYERSLVTLEKYKDEKFDLMIDLHRDAYDEAIIASRAASVGGSEAAQLMALIGNGEGFNEKPDTRSNLVFARSLTERVNALAPGLMRPVLVKTGRYNQHVSTPAILVEVGHNRNTLREALNAMPTLARALAEQLSEKQ